MTDEKKPPKESEPIRPVEDPEEPTEKETSADDPGGTFTADENERFQQALAEAANVSRQVTESIQRIRQPVIDIIEQNRAIAEAARNTLAEGIQTIERIKSPVIEAMEAIKEATTYTQEIMQKVNNAAPTLTAIQNFYNSIDWQNMRQALIQGAEIIAPLMEFAEEITEEGLTPYLEAELKKPEYEGKTIEELFENVEFDENGRPSETSLFMQALTAARDAKTAKETKTAVIKKTNKIDYPLDKLNSHVWNLLETDTAGQIQFDMSKHGSKKEIPVYYAIDFDDLGENITITKRLQTFDKFVYNAVAALFNAGNHVITLTQIYSHMGYKGKPGRRDLEKINLSILKMSNAQIYINNEAEAEAYNYGKTIYRASLLPLESGEQYNVQGALTNAAIHIFREPPLISFARERKQITTVDIKLLQSPVNKTEANLQIEDYLLVRISKAKHGKTRNCRILFKTLYKHASITTKKQEQRAPEKVKTYLKHYQDNGFITRFTMEKNGITVYW